MATLIPDAERNYLADQEAARITHLSLHEGSPGVTGANEAAGGSPAYARKAVTFNAAGAVGPLGASAQPATVGVAWSSEVTFDVDAATYSHWGAWSAASAGTFRQGNVLSSSQSPTGQAQIKLSIGVGPFAGA
ncbi:phage tail fiber protein [Terrabacter terrigena]|uniref:Uncharacterized protein n=1 Tax=Terrabacter terrigena TaxID=574718 RepID=A0ABW3N020_9MICO